MNYLQLELGGVKRGLKFNMYTLEIFEQRTGKNPLEEIGVLKNKDFRPFKDIVFEIYYAALLSNCKTKKVDPDFTEEQAKDWFQDLHPVYLYKIIGAYNLPQEDHSANGEVGKEEKPVTFQGT